MPERPNAPAIRCLAHADQRGDRGRRGYKDDCPECVKEALDKAYRFDRVCIFFLYAKGPEEALSRISEVCISYGLAVGKEPWA